MESRKQLAERWAELQRYWNDQTTREFDRRYRYELNNLLVSIEAEFEAFKEATRER